MQYIQACLLTKQNFFWCFDAGLEHIVASLVVMEQIKSCDISPCDLSPDGNTEKYGRPMKSAIYFFKSFVYMYACTTFY